MVEWEPEPWTGLSPESSDSAQNVATAEEQAELLLLAEQALERRGEPDPPGSMPWVVWFAHHVND